MRCRWPGIRSRGCSHFAPVCQPGLPSREGASPGTAGYYLPCRGEPQGGIGLALLPKSVRALLITNADESQVQGALAGAFGNPVSLTDIRWRGLRGIAGSHWERISVDPQDFAVSNGLTTAPQSVVVFRHLGGPYEFTVLQQPSSSNERVFAVTATEWGDQSLHPPAVIGFSTAKHFAMRAASLLPDSLEVRVDTEKARI